jgi:hypothetical protein
VRASRGGQCDKMRRSLRNVEWHKAFGLNLPVAFFKFWTLTPMVHSIKERGNMRRAYRRSLLVKARGGEQAERWLEGGLRQRDFSGT